MPKRSYPFEDNLLPQSKIHINDKIIETNNEDSLKKVYCKTLEKLFKGAKVKSSNEKNNQDQLRDVLYDCNICKSNSIVTGKCWFCDNKLCKDCEQTCHNCKEIFCNSCSLVMYQDNFDAICLSCVNN